MVQFHLNLMKSNTFTQIMQILYDLNFATYSKYIIIFEFILSLFILLFLIFTILKRNYVNIYCLYVLNIIIIIFFITIVIEEIYMSKYLMFINSLDPSIFTNKTITAYTFYVLSKDLLEYYTNLNIYDLYFTCINLPFYNNNFEFNFFRYNIKIFTIFFFLLCLILAYFQRKAMKISFDKILLILFPILLSNLLLIQTQDLIIAYLSIELQNLCLIFLIGLKKNNNFNIQLSIRFFILNSVGSLFILFGIFFIYSKLHTTNLSDIYILISSLPFEFLSVYFIHFIFGLFFIIIGLFFKLGVGPFGLWLVEMYENSITYSVFIFSLLPKIGYFVFIFHLYLATSHFSIFWDIFLKIFGILSIFIGTFGALSQIYVKRLLAFSSLNYFGYILLSFIGFKEKGALLCVLYIFFYICISLYIWFIIMYLEKVLKRNVILIDLIIIRDHYPFLAILLSFSFLFLAGLPPLYLFILKFYTFNILIQTETTYFIILMFLFCSFISIIYYLRLIKIIQFNPLPNRSYKMYRINSIIAFLIVVYSLILISPVIFIFINSIYLLFSKLIKDYLYVIYSDKKKAFNIIYKLVKRFKINGAFDITLKHKINNIFFVFFKFPNYSFTYHSLVVDTTKHIKYIIKKDRINRLRNEIIRSKHIIIAKFLKEFNINSLNINKKLDKAFFKSLNNIIVLSRSIFLNPLFLRHTKYFQHLLYNTTSVMSNYKRYFKIIRTFVVFPKKNFIYNTSYSIKDKIYLKFLKSLYIKKLKRSIILFHYNVNVLNKYIPNKIWIKYASNFIYIYNKMLEYYSAKILKNKYLYNTFKEINKLYEINNGLDKKRINVKAIIIKYKLKLYRNYLRFKKKLNKS